LDYSKGLPDRMRSFKRFLELFPQHRKAATLMQIAPPTREDVQAYVDIRHELESLSGEINGQFGDFDWTPVRYIHRNIDRETLAALYRGSQVGLVTPLRDGMNLVAKEYVAAQDENDPGVLVLSRFAGAAEELEEALIVNPYDADEVAAAIHRAIDMPRHERIERHRKLLKRVRAHDAHHWAESFLRTLEAECDETNAPENSEGDDDAAPPTEFQGVPYLAGQNPPYSELPPTGSATQPSTSVSERLTDILQRLALGSNAPAPLDDPRNQHH
jgi:trehalose 6-phosphate synthase